MYRASDGAKWRIARPRLSVGMVVPPILHIFDPERAGVDHDRLFAAPDTNDLERKTRDDRLSIGHRESEPPDDAVDIRLDRDFPGSQRSGAELGLTLHDGFVAFQERRRIVSPGGSGRSGSG